MPEIIDLSTLLGGSEPPKDDRKVDLSGRPRPENIRVQLNSGVELKCDVKYDGMEDGRRRYLVIAEIDWENYWPTTLIVGIYPADCMLSFKMPDDMADSEMYRRAGKLNVVVERSI